MNATLALSSDASLSLSAERTLPAASVGGGIPFDDGVSRPIERLSDQLERDARRYDRLFREEDTLWNP